MEPNNDESSPNQTIQYLDDKFLKVSELVDQHQCVLKHVMMEIIQTMMVVLVVF
jgi:hypothetical protein